MSYEMPKHKVFSQEDGNVYCFYCDVSGALVYISEPLRAENPQEELQRAWESGAQTKFNRCKMCGRLVSDIMYNAETLYCVICTPWEGPPKFCPQCGKRIRKLTEQCPRCNSYLRYEGIETWRKTITGENTEKP